MQNIPITEGEKVHCLDVAKAVVSNKLGAVEDTEEFRVVMDDIEGKFAETYASKASATVVSTTHQRKKEDIASRTLQRHWREHKRRQLAKRLARAQLMRDAGRQVRSEHERVVEELLCCVEKNKPPSLPLLGQPDLPARVDHQPQQIHALHEDPPTQRDGLGREHHAGERQVKHFSHYSTLSYFITVCLITIKMSK